MLSLLSKSPFRCLHIAHTEDRGAIQLKRVRSSERPIEERERREKPPLMISTTNRVVQGFINFISGPSDEARYLRDMYVFHVVPMLNPEGVVSGNSRCSLNGLDLNRQYSAPRRGLEQNAPTVAFLLRAPRLDS